MVRMQKGYAIKQRQSSCLMSLLLTMVFIFAEENVYSTLTLTA
jgi:hypothetical protein